MPTWHLIFGEDGCRFAVERQCTAIIVDALRASATAAMLLHHGANRVLAVQSVDEARAAKEALPDALLYGERNAVPPQGFDYGNSPLEAPHANGRDVIFTTTTGAGRLVSVANTPTAFMGTTVNRIAVASAAIATGSEVVVIPAGLWGNANFPADEDWCAAAAIITASGQPLGEGADDYAHWQNRIEEEGIAAIFQSAPHAENLRKTNQAADITECAHVDTTTTVPQVTSAEHNGVWIENTHDSKWVE